MKVTLLRITNEAEALIAEAARISHSGKFDTTRKLDDSANAELIEKLLSWGHESVFEHASATFLIEGISRVCSHQLVRHRLASFTQRSSRYCLSDVPMVYPEFQTEDNHLKEIFHKAIQHSKEAYDSLVMAGIPMEDARFVLPQAESTSLVMTANFREWRTIFKLRCSPHAQWEIRCLCKSILSKLLEKAPNVFGDLRPLACLTTDAKEDKEEPQAKKDTAFGLQTHTTHNRGHDMPSESMMNDIYPSDEELQRILLKEKEEKRARDQAVVDGFLSGDRCLSEERLAFQCEKFDKWMGSGALAGFVEATWSLYRGCGRKEGTPRYARWVSAVEDAFGGQAESVTATVRAEAFLYEVSLDIRLSDGRVYECRRRYDKADFYGIETFHDKKVRFMDMFFRGGLDKVGELATEVRMGYRDAKERPFDRPLQELPEPEKMDHSKFSEICGKIEAEAKEGIPVDEAAYLSRLRSEV